MEKISALESKVSSYLQDVIITKDNVKDLGRSDKTTVISVETLPRDPYEELYRGR